MSTYVDTAREEDIATGNIYTKAENIASPQVNSPRSFWQLFMKRSTHGGVDYCIVSVESILRKIYTSRVMWKHTKILIFEEFKRKSISTIIFKTHSHYKKFLISMWKWHSFRRSFFHINMKLRARHCVTSTTLQFALLLISADNHCIRYRSYLSMC